MLNVYYPEIDTVYRFRMSTQIFTLDQSTIDDVGNDDKSTPSEYDKCF
jgi:hypothetical protein